jgi:hypothetical protein
MKGSVIKTIAVGSLTVFGSALAGHYYGVMKDSWHEEPESFAVLMSTTSSAAILIQDTISGDAIEVPPIPPPVLKSSA